MSHSRVQFTQALELSAPNVVPDLLGEHFERPLYIEMAALLALYDERPTTAQGLTEVLLNEERRYWQGVLAHLNWPEPERRAEQLLALTTLAGGFAIPRDAEQYWVKAKGKVISPAEFNFMYRDLVTLYPGTQGLQPLRPDLLGEALVAQALLRSQGDTLLDAVLSKDASQPIRRNALTVLARVSNHRPDLEETLVNALSRHFSHCYRDIVAVSTETISRLPVLAALAFERLSPGNKSQVAGLLAPLFEEESVQLADLSCLVSEYLVDKAREKFERKPGNPNQIAEYAQALGSYAVDLSRTGRYEQACEVDLKSLELFRRLIIKDPNCFEPNYANALDNYATDLTDAGKYEKALEHAREALEIYRRLAEKNPDRFADDLFNSTCLTQFLAWLCDQADVSDKSNLGQLMMFVPSHRRSLMLFSLAFVEGCSAADIAARKDAFGQVLSHWDDLSTQGKTRGEPYWLCAAAWCAKFEPAEVSNTDWETSWRQFIKQRNGNVPQWMLDMARRLDFQWPE